MSYENETEETKYDESFFENIALTIFNHLNLDAYFIFEVNLVDENEIHSINKEYRKILKVDKEKCLEIAKKLHY